MFLREKNYFRSPTLAELNKLRETVRQIACSQCGGPIDLSEDTACTHCGAPIALIDPDGVAKAVHELTIGQASISPATEEQTRIIISGIDKQQVGETAAQIRRLREPEPYKGKGIRYSDEVVRRKAGKAGKVGGKKK